MINSCCAEAKPLQLMSTHTVLHYIMACGGSNCRTSTKGRSIPGEASSQPSCLTRCIQPRNPTFKKAPSFLSGCRMSRKFGCNQPHRGILGENRKPGCQTLSWRHLDVHSPWGNPSVQTVSLTINENHVQVVQEKCTAGYTSWFDALRLWKLLSPNQGCSWSFF